MTPNIEISNLIKPLVDTYKTLSAEWKEFFEIGLTEYLYSQSDKYYFTNTFIHRSEKIRFHDIYYPIKARYKELRTDFTNLHDIFDEYQYITIIGSAGSGKTTMMKHIFLGAINSLQKIPILIELRHLNEFEGDLEKLIAEKILKSRLKPSESIFQRTLKSGKFLFLLDGYDEIFSNKKQEIIRQIELFVDSYPKNNFLITTRPGSGIESFPRFYDFKVCSLHDDDILAFISKIVEEGERRDRISNLVLDPKNENYFEFLRNPLLLSMFILAFENHPEIPKRKSAFYRNVFDTLYSRHDGITKNSFPREKLTQLQRDDFEDILSVFSYLTLLEGQYTFTSEYLTDILRRVKNSTDFDFKVDDLIYDLRTSISILVLDGFEYYFPHRSMQEYFTALFINKLPTDKKHRAYKNLAIILQESSTDHSFNFWSLCFEMDETIFVSNFLIPQLKKIYKKLEGKQKKDLLDSYFQIVDPVLIKNEFDIGISEFRIYRQSNFQNAILDFCEVYDYRILWKSPMQNGFHTELESILIDKSKKMGREKTMKQYGIKGDDEIYNLLVENEVLDIIETYRTNIFEKINQWDIDVKRKKSNIDDLLNI